MRMRVESQSGKRKVFGELKGNGEEEKSEDDMVEKPKETGKRSYREEDHGVLNLRRCSDDKKSRVVIKDAKCHCRGCLRKGRAARGRTKEPGLEEWGEGGYKVN